MNKMYKRTLHIFRRDLRLEDNTALMRALENSLEVLPCFIFDDRQLKTNPYHSENAVAFMLGSLKSLDQALRKRGGRLFYFQGQPSEVVSRLIKEYEIQAVFLNGDYTPFSQKRDLEISKVCAEQGAELRAFEDVLLNPPRKVLKKDGSPYRVFTPFWKFSRTIPVKVPQENSFENYFKKPVEFELKAPFEVIKASPSPRVLLKGGREEALSLLKKIENLEAYNIKRDFPAEDFTSQLSAHNKFGTLSVREFFHHIVRVLGVDHPLVTQLYWRDFFTHIGFHFPHVFGHAFRREYEGIPWRKDEEDFERWCAGQTGFPLVDAGMRQLNATGYMHNRVRMVVASFLVKDLHLDWRWGERYFAQKLIDYDPAVNNGNWQWAASTGCDAQPYFRVFNPWRQQERFDPEGVYMKTWVPELKDVTNFQAPHQEAPTYPKPMVDHGVCSKKAVALFKNTLS